MPTSRKNEISKAWINDLYADEKWWIETKSQISISSPPLAVVFCAWCRWGGYGSKKLPPSLTWPITLPLILFFLTKLGQVLADVINGVRHSTHTGLYSYLRPELHTYHQIHAHVHHNQDDSFSFMGNCRVNINHDHTMIIMISPATPLWWCMAAAEQGQAWCRALSLSHLLWLLSSQFRPRARTAHSHTWRCSLQL